MSEELKAAQARIACLEGEIAKRDEELAACRVAVENCDLFRARIAELTAELAESRQCAEIMQQGAFAYQAELAAIRAQEPVVWPDDKLIELAFTTFGGKWNGDLWTIEDANLHPFVRAFAAPVSEAKAHGVVMPERWNVPRPMWKDARQPYGNPLNHADIEAAEKFNLALDEVARLNSAPVQQVSVPPFAQKVIRKLERFQECTDDGQGADIGRHWFDLLTQLGLLNRVQRSPALWEITQQGEDLLAAAPAAPAADAWIPVSERLPGDQGHDSEEVLCFLNGHCSLLDNECRQGGGWGIRLGYYDADIGTFRVFGRPESHVTHWMPLPAAPIKIEANRHDQ